MSLRIAFDMDGVLAHMEKELIQQAERVFGEQMTRRQRQSVPADGAEESAQDDEPKLRMTSRQQRKLWRHVEGIENFWETLEECEPGIVERIAGLAVERRWEIIFLTRRPEGAGATAQVQTQRWLQSKGFPVPSVYVVQASRGRIAAALDLDIVVDDRPENCLDVVVDSNARAILVWREHESLLPAGARRLGIGVVRTVAECLDVLQQIDTLARDPEPGMIDRVLRLLGLKEPA